MLRIGYGKSAVREIPLAVHTRVDNPQGQEPLDPINLSLYDRYQIVG